MFVLRWSNYNGKKPLSQGFTIVELLVVVVVIAILAAITIVSYNGIRERAVSSMLQSELSTASTTLKMDLARTNQFPLSLAVANEGKGMTFGDDIEVTYVPEEGSVSPQTFCLSLTKGTKSYFITEKTQPGEGACEAPAPVLTYSEMVLEDEPSAYWRFQNIGTTTVPNAASAARPLTQVNLTGLGAASLLGEESDYSWDLPGGSNVYATAPNESWQHVSSFTAEALIQPDSVTGYRAVISHDGSSTPTYRSWNLYVRDGKLVAYDYSAGGDVVISSTTLVAGQTYHVAMTYTGGVTKLYINGVLDGTKTGSILRTTTNNRPFVIGATYAGGSSPTFLFDGRIDEVAFYASVLSDERIQAHAAKAGF